MPVTPPGLFPCCSPRPRRLPNSSPTPKSPSSSSSYQTGTKHLKWATDWAENFTRISSQPCHQGLPLALYNRSGSRGLVRKSSCPKLHHKAQSQDLNPGQLDSRVNALTRALEDSPSILSSKIFFQGYSLANTRALLCAPTAQCVFSLSRPLLHDLTLHLRAVALAVPSTWNGMFFSSET